MNLIHRFAVICVDIKMKRNTLLLQCISFKKDLCLSGWLFHFVYNQIFNKA